MSFIPSAAERATFAGIADVLIPAAEGMPSATEVEVHGIALDHVLGLRPELIESFRRGLSAAAGDPPAHAADQLSRTDPDALQSIGLLAAAAYYMDARVRGLLGYPGQISRPAMPEEEHDYQQDGWLQAVIDRGPIWRRAPE